MGRLKSATKEREREREKCVKRQPGQDDRSFLRFGRLGWKRKYIGKCGGVEEGGGKKALFRFNEQSWRRICLPLPRVAVI